MKLYITARFKNADPTQIEQLCEAARKAGFEDFSFIRDVENYQKVFDDPKELWKRTLQELSACDALLIDLSDHPSGGRVVEAGMAFALHMPIIAIVKQGLEYKEVYQGISTHIIEYDNLEHLSRELSSKSEL